MSGINPIGSTDYSWLFSTNTKKQDSVAQLWNAYGNYQSNAQTALSGLSEINANLKAVLASYDEAKTTFNLEFEENMSALSESSKQIQKYSFSVPKEGAITKTETTNENGIISSETTYSKDLQSALDVVSEFVSNYNSSLKFFNDNASVSNRVANLATVFSDATYRASAYESIGLTVNAGGMIEINEEVLANAIVENPDRVSGLLGDGGLATKVDSHISYANSQYDRLFPSAEKMLGNQLSTAAIYTSNAYRNMTAYASVGNLINMLF